MQNMKKIVFGSVLAAVGLSFAGLTDYLKIGTCVAFPAECATVYGTVAGTKLGVSLTNSLINGEKHACGTMDDAMDIGFTELFIPDQFPPDEAASQILVDMAIPGSASMQLCRAVATVDLSNACLQHDVCRETRGRTGTASYTCDDNLKAQWESACRGGYGSADPCRAICLGVVDASWDIMMKQLKQWDGIRASEAVNYYYQNR
jgi:hypothetical protein